MNMKGQMHMNPKKLAHMLNVQNVEKKFLCKNNSEHSFSLYLCSTKKINYADYKRLLARISISINTSNKSVVDCSTQSIVGMMRLREGAMKVRVLM